MYYRILSAEYHEHIKTFSAFLGPCVEIEQRLNLILTVAPAANVTANYNVTQKAL